MVFFSVPKLLQIFVTNMRIFAMLLQKETQAVFRQPLPENRIVVGDPFDMQSCALRRMLEKCPEM